MALKYVSSIQKLLRSASEIENVVINGWVQKEHKKGRWSFLHISDGETNETIQVVVPKDVGHNIGIGSAVTVSGKWHKSQGKQQLMEIIANNCRVWSKDEGNLNVSSSNQIRGQLHVRSKHPSYASLVRIRSTVTSIAHRFFNERGYLHIDTPLISSNDCEGAGEAFIVKSAGDEDFFGSENKFLPVSGQLHLEAMISSFPKVYTLNAAFRAEKSLSRQHLAEFRMLEAEIGFVDNVDHLCNEVEDFIKYVKAESLMLSAEKAHLNFFTNEETSEMSLLDCLSPTEPFPRLTYNDAVKMLESNGEKVTNGFNKTQELQLVAMCKSPVFVTHFPSEQKPFYMKRSEDGKYALCFDLLAPFVGELVGGSVREDDVQKMRERMNLPALKWYYDLRSRGTPQSGGFGIGFERFIQTMFGIGNIKDTIPFPRWDKYSFYFKNLNDLMVKQKHRYFLLENVMLSKLFAEDITAAITNKVKEMYGDYGVGAIREFKHRQFKAPAGMCIIRSLAETENIIDSVLPFITAVGSNIVQIKTLKKSSTIRSLYIFAWEEHNRRLYAGAAKGKDEFFHQKLALTTGKNVPKIRKKKR